MTFPTLEGRIAALREHAAKLDADGYDNRSLAQAAFTRANDAYWFAIKVSDNLRAEANRLETGS